VVLGHALSYADTYECFLRNYRAIFTLPVFFFISGYLFRIKEKEKSFKPYILSSIKSLIIPYIFLNLLAVLLDLPHYLHHGIKTDLIYFLIGHGHAPAGPAWFLLCMFWIRIQVFFVSKLSDKMILLVAILYGILAYFFPWHLYWTIDTSFMAMPIFLIGYLAKKHVSEPINKHYSPWVLIGIVLITAAAIFGLTFIQGKESMFSRMFGTSGILFYVGAFVGIIMVIAFCKLIEGSMNKVISVVSSGSIIIMGLHGFFYVHTIKALNKFSILTYSELNIPFKILICLVVIAEMYIPILLLQKYCSQFLGGRKS